MSCNMLMSFYIIACIFQLRAFSTYICLQHEHCLETDLFSESARFKVSCVILRAVSFGDLPKRWCYRENVF